MSSGGSGIRTLIAPFWFGSRTNAPRIPFPDLSQRQLASLSAGAEEGEQIVRKMKNRHGAFISTRKPKLRNARMHPHSKRRSVVEFGLWSSPESDSLVLVNVKGGVVFVVVVCRREQTHIRHINMRG